MRADRDSPLLAASRASPLLGAAAGMRKPVTKRPRRSFSVSASAQGSASDHSASMVTIIASAAEHASAVDLSSFIEGLLVSVSEQATAVDHPASTGSLSSSAVEHSSAVDHPASTAIVMASAEEHASAADAPSSPGDDYPESVVAAGLEDVWDLRVGGPTPVGPRSPTTKTLGVDALPAGFTYDGTVLTGTGTNSISNWDLSTIPAAGYVQTTGSGMVTFNDCIFGFNPLTTISYSLYVGFDGNPSTTICNYCKFDGGRLSRSQPSAAFNVINGNGTMTLDHCDIVNQPADACKSNGNLTMTWCRIQCCGWYSGSDPDGLQASGGTVDVENCLFDVRDGSDLGNAFPGEPLNNFFRVESFGGAFGNITCKNNIMVGIQGFGTLPGAGIALDVKDVNPNAFTGTILYQNNVVQKGKTNYSYADGTSRYPLLTSGQWTGNIDFDTSAVITQPITG